MSDMCVCACVRAFVHACTWSWMHADACLFCFVFPKVFQTWESQVHGCSSLQTFLTLLHFPHTKSWRYSHNPNSTFVNVQPELGFPADVVSKFSYLKCGKNLKSRSLKSRKIMRYLYRVLVGSTRNEPKMQENFKLWDLKSGLYCTYLHFCQCGLVSNLNHFMLIPFVYFVCVVALLLSDDVISSHYVALNSRMTWTLD